MNNRISRTPVVLLRVAAALMLLHFLGHTAGMMQGPSHGVEEAAVREAMKGHSFDMIGTSRSYWDFYLGLGFDASINMLMQTVLLWLLAGLVRRDPVGTRPFIALLAVGWVGAVVLDVKYFFAAPLVFALVIVAVLVAAWITAKESSTVKAGAH